MFNSAKFVSKLLVVMVVFFSLQGEVIARYVDLFQGKVENRTNIPKGTVEYRQLVKLQCYTQKIAPFTLPPDSDFVINTVSVRKPAIEYIVFDSRKTGLACSPFPSLRGPPAFS